MSIGLGKNYWVRLVSHCYGSLDKCIDFMNNCKRSKSQWFELRNEVKVLPGGKSIPGENYICDLVESDR